MDQKEKTILMQKGPASRETAQKQLQVHNLPMDDVEKY